MVKLFKNRIVVAKAEARDAWFSRGYLPHFDGERVPSTSVLAFLTRCHSTCCNAGAKS